MQIKWPWFDRKFQFDFPAEKMPDIVERLRGTPARIDEAVSLFAEETITRREGDSWSIQENIGHLSDVEPLWIGRIDDILNRLAEMRPADLSNARTFEADHHSRSLVDLCSDFRVLRRELVETLLELSPEQWSLSAMHPRLKKPMRVVDLCFFVAEHDDYHLARMRYLESQWSS